jgi:MoaA/NifB/PqqE/SkfB family radical SAM enzyme
VSPCVYTAVTGQQEFPRFHDGRMLEIPAERFGNVNERSLMEIWELPAYRAFRQQFAARLVSAAKIAVGGVRAAAAVEVGPAPESCRSCPKLYGL